MLRYLLILLALIPGSVWAQYDEYQELEPSPSLSSLDLQANGVFLDDSPNYAFGLYYNHNGNLSIGFTTSLCSALEQSKLPYSRGFQSIFEFRRYLKSDLGNHQGFYLGAYLNLKYMDSDNEKAFGGYKESYFWSWNGMNRTVLPYYYSKQYFGIAPGLSIGYQRPIGPKLYWQAWSQIGYFLLHEEQFSNEPVASLDTRPELNQLDLRLAIGLSYRF